MIDIADSIGMLLLGFKKSNIYSISVSVKTRFIFKIKLIYKQKKSILF